MRRGGTVFIRQGEALLRVVLGNIDEAVFQNVFAVGLREMQELGTLSDSKAAELLYSLTAGLDRVSLVEVVRENEFKKNPKPQIIEKNITLLESNEISARVRSKPDEFLIFNISASNVPTDKYFLLGSYGKDKTGGGERFEQDIIWRSDSYPNFQ